jgi:hypothetical protein
MMMLRFLKVSAIGLRESREGRGGIRGIGGGSGSFNVVAILSVLLKRKMNKQRKRTIIIKELMEQ